MTSWATVDLPRIAEAGIDLRALAFTVVISIATGLLFGIIPAMQSARADVGEALKRRGRGASARHGMRGSLVIAEVALAVVVVVGAGLLLRSLWRMQAVDPGFAAENRFVARVGLPSEYGEPAERALFFEQLLDNVAAAPGVEAVAATTRLPMGGDFSIAFTIEGRPEPPEGQEPSAEMRVVSPGYFAALEIPLYPRT